ncbi:MAG: flagellar biosynthetic protein FliQ [Planctomycetota bacterium]|jgi:flagellar biosynthesis protein FliQ|nr:flagellar biosynthetic protein FliQ [Pirellulales bacterium]MDA0253450.1 flagellar biosynthetic protein FliQ [Planctomycetota bacterium]MDA1201273.1 flagellar biosynthetic protein FliQ [Planctomycetota bacterium]
MTGTDLVELVREAVLAGGILLTPVLLAGLGVGLVTGLVQAATGVQEPIIGLVPRLLVMGLAVLWTLPWMVDRLAELFRLAAGP